MARQTTAYLDLVRKHFPLHGRIIQFGVGITNFLATNEQLETLRYTWFRTMPKYNHTTQVHSRKVTYSSLYSTDTEIFESEASEDWGVFVQVQPKSSITELLLWQSSAAL